MSLSVSLDQGPQLGGLTGYGTSGPDYRDEAIILSKELIHEYGYTQVWKAKLGVDSMKRITEAGKGSDDEESWRQPKITGEGPDTRV